MLYASIAFDSRFGLTPEQTMRKAQAFIHNTEKLLGAESGSLSAPMARLFERAF